MRQSVINYVKENGIKLAANSKYRAQPPAGAGAHLPDPWLLQ